MYCPLIQQIDYQNPLPIFAHFSGQSGSIFFDSAERRPHCGRYSFMAVDPFAIFCSKNGTIQMNDDSLQGNPFDLLQKKLELFTFEGHADLPPFQGGVAGFFSYDLYQHLEQIPLHKIDDMQFHDLMLGFYDLVIAFDHELQRAWIFSSGFPYQAQQRAQHAEKRLRWLNDEINKIDVSFLSTEIFKKNAIEISFTQNDYQQAVQKVKKYILAGDIFEACISQRFKTILPKNIKPFELYCRLRSINPAPFAAYMNFFDTVIASASPERFLKLSQGKIESRPIKGTRARGKNNREDELLAQQLTNSAKDHAENVMIVDLLRNDLSRVCEDHSVKVPQLCGLETYSNVHHLVSVITGQLRRHLTAVDLLRATFPGGSITGAPKIRAMEIIAEIEPTARGPYCGSVGYIGFQGDMDSSIVIRTFNIKENIITFQAGGAVVADSDPVEEYQETLVKASALRKVLEDA